MVKIVSTTEIREKKHARKMLVLSIAAIIVVGISMYEVFTVEFVRLASSPPPITTNPMPPPSNSTNSPPTAGISVQAADSGADVYVKSMNGEVNWNNTSLKVTWDSGTATWLYSYAVGYNYHDGGYNLTKSGKTPIGGYATIGNPLTGGSTSYLMDGSGIFINLVPGISHFSINDIQTHTTIASWSR